MKHQILVRQLQFQSLLIITSGKLLYRLVCSLFLFTIRQKCSYYFEPKENRPPINNPEYILGSHLYLHFSTDATTSKVKTDFNPQVFLDSYLPSVDSLTHIKSVQEKGILIQVSTFPKPVSNFLNCFLFHCRTSCPG